MTDEQPKDLSGFDFEQANARALGILALAAGGRLEVPPPPETLGYSISYQPDGSVYVNAALSNMPVTSHNLHFPAPLPDTSEGTA